MSILTVAEARALLATALDDTALSAVIEREEAMVLERIGPPGDGLTAISETRDGTGRALYLRLPIASVTSVTEQPYTSSVATTVPASEYVVWAAEGRIKRHVAPFQGTVTITYVPQDTRDKWKSVLIELVRLALEQTAMRSENTAGEYSYTAPEWEAARERLYRRLNFVSV